MTSSAPWSVKGIDPNAREAAKEQARRSGMTLGEWLTRRIRLEGEGEGESESGAHGPLSRALDRLTSRIEMAEQRSTLAVTGIDQSVRGVLARLEIAERDQVAIGARFEGALQETAEAQSVLNERVARLEDHTAGPRSLEAIKGLEGSIARLANQVYDGEGRQRETVADLRRDIGGLAARIESAEQTGPAGNADLVAARVGERLDQAEARTTTALRALETSFAQLDRRLDTAESRLDGSNDSASGLLERRLGEIAANLAGSVEAARLEMAEQLRASADGRFDRMDQALKEMNAHVLAAEQRSAEAIERMGREVLRVAEALNRKVAVGEQRAADAIEQVGGEVARVVTALDGRLHRTETTQGLALEKLGADITRITERLTERIGVAERRSAQAIDDVDEQISRVTERLNQRYDRSASDLAERIRQSEERTVRLLEEARERLDGRLGSTARTTQDAPARAVPPANADPFDAPAFPAGSTGRLAAEGPPQHVIYPDVAPFGQAFAPEGFTPVVPAFEAGDIDAASDFAAPVRPQSEADFVDGPPTNQPTLHEAVRFDSTFEEDVAETAAEEFGDLDMDVGPPPAAPQSARALSTRELIEQARASARAGQAERSGGSRRRQDAHGAMASGGFGGVPFVTRRKKKDRTRTVLAASFVLATMMLVGGGLIYAAGGMPDQLARLMGEASPQSAPVTEPAPRMAVALDPQPITPGDALTSANAAAVAAVTPAPAISHPAPAGPNPEDLLSQGRTRIDAKDGKTGLPLVKQAANLGDPEAQRYLGGLYKDGKAGLTRDLTEARRWFERAAAGGDPTAMHETALLQYNGEGGPKNQTSAAEWFRRAADLGSTDSQFNLGVLYESGVGVSKNPAEAYKWYLLATRDTDETKRDEAKAAADRVKGQISPDAQAVAERFVASFVPQTPTVAPSTVDAAAAKLKVSSR